MGFKYIEKLLSFYKKILNSHFFEKQCMSRIEHIDTNSQTVIVHTRGINAPLHLKFNEIIKDEALLSSFSSRHASYIGYFYGIHNGKEASDTNISYFRCFTGNHSNKFTIRGLDRYRNVVYQNQMNKNQMIQSPDQILAIADKINNFPPLQACYIGILAGINHTKKQKTPIKYQKLRLV